MVTFGYGIKATDIDVMTPKELDPYYKAYILKQKADDRGRWEQGLYNHVAVAVAIDKTFNGKKATSKYPEKPFHQMEDNSSSQDEALKKAKLLFANLGIMQSNFNLAKKKKAETKE